MLVTFYETCLNILQKVNCFKNAIQVSPRNGQFQPLCEAWGEKYIVIS
jgi:hypothetical protein